MLTNGLSSSAVLAAFAESLVEGRRVVVLGSALSPTPRLLLDRGARLVHVCDPAPLRVAEALRRPGVPGLTISTLNDDEVAAREGAVDCVLVEHLGAFDARSVVEKVRKLLAVRGVALFATPNREARRPLLPASEPSAAPLDYYALYDLVKAEFESVRMLGQAPFVGYAVVDFAPDGEPEPTVDSDFVPRGSEEPELFVAVAARHRPSIPAHALIQLPLESVIVQPAPVERPARPERAAPPAELVRKLEQQEAWIRELEGRAEAADERADLAEEELEALREKFTQDGDAVSRQAAEAAQEVVDAARRSETAARGAETTARKAEEAARRSEAGAREAEAATRARLEELSAELKRKHTELESHRAELAGKRTELESHRAELAGKRAELESRRAELESHRAELESHRAELDAERAETEAARRERDAFATRIRDLEAELEEKNNELSAFGAEASGEHARELQALEERLSDRGQEIRRLERDVAEAERIGKELVAEVRLVRATPVASAASSEELEALALRLATAEADREALSWAASIHGQSGRRS